MGKQLGTMNIYKNKNYECSNGGISSEYDEVIIWDSEDDEDAPMNAVYIKDRGQWGLAAYPVNSKCKKGVGGMFGGSFIYTCNGVVPHSGKAIKLHDRFESQELYNALSM